MTECHPLLRRQLRRLGLDDSSPPSPRQWTAFLEAVGRSYEQADNDRYTMERSLLISSLELRQLYDDLKASSETKLAEERDKLRETNHFLDSIFENIPNMVFVKDATTLRFVRFNRAGEELVGIQSEELIGKSDHDLFPAEQADAFVSRDREVLGQRGLVVIEDEPLQTKEAGIRRLRTKKMPICGDSGEPKYLLGISEDITEARRHEHELRAAKETAEKASRAKSDFLANMSHELRTPLNAILGFARVLDRGLAGKLNSDQREFFVYIAQAAEHMLRLVNDLLDLRSLDEVALSIGNVSLAPVIHAAADMLRPLIDEKGITLTVDIPDRVQVLGVHGALSQVFINLLSNAIKFTPAGGRVDIVVSEVAGDLCLVVADTGIGIPVDFLPYVFDRFRQADAGPTREHAGLGLGLAIVRHLVELHGGTIEAASAPGEGATFTARLPAAGTPADPLPPPARPPVAARDRQSR